MSTWVNVRLSTTRFFGKTRTIAISGPWRHNFTWAALPVLLAAAGCLASAATARSAGQPPADVGRVYLPGAAATARRDTSAAEDGQTLVSRAAAQLAATPSLEAKLRQQVQLFGQELSGSGTYLQKQSPQGLLLRLELKLQVGSQLSSLQEVCDGRFLWIRRDLPGGASLGRVDLERIRAAIRQRGQPPWADAATNWLALGGLPRLLSALAENFAFSAPQAVRSDKVPMWVVDGRWKPERLAELQPDLKDKILAGKPIDPQRLPAQLPTDVRIVLGQSDLVPRRIEYRRLPADSAGDKKAAAQPAVVLEIVELQRRENLDDRLFAYQPGNQEVADYTDLYLASLKLDLPAERKPD